MIRKLRNFIPSSVVFCFSLLAAQNSTAENPIKSLAPDLSFNLSCQSELPSDFEKQTERFLSENKFHFINLGKLQRKRGLVVYRTRIIAFRWDNILVDIIVFKNNNISYLSLLSRPPTKRAALLEEAILEFGRSIESCRIKQIERHTNDDGAQDFFDSQLQRTKNLYDEAQREKKE